ncbi:AAA family ATPase [Acinetobacter sp. CFCC 10889]|uniref:AAA family ATPase n=1 Tax=Acinetobacter sp. CFCC 10889 TaxID=1775557 RepID=UPI003A4D34CE
MRLSSLKLSGFKSFADSATLQFKANRTAVVGPNGCGKSNVIDAIRWVMGESSARQLRGGSMQDVIFTGTSKRKPVGMASVELRFENTYGKLGGTYNAYSELAVRRQVNRDGKSEYFLNGTKCRRRDITDIFLGTGLGPRSYAIIEQGMINRLVDAKPEEMRVFIEEAAGVSRYQARRKETLQHLEHTTQNLERLEDISSELLSQLKTLKRQSESAVQYKTLETQIRTLKVEILSFQCEQSSRLQEQYAVEMNELGEHFKLVRSDMTTLEHDLAATSELFQRLIQQSSPLQQEWQQAEKKLSELKMTLEQKQSLFQQNSEMVGQLEQQKVQTKERIQLLELQLDTLFTQVDEQSQTLQTLESETQLSQQSGADLKAQQAEAQKQFEQIKNQVEKQQQQKAQMQAQIEHLTKNVSRLEQQKDTLKQQAVQVQKQCQSEGLSQLEQEKNVLQAQVVELENAIAVAKTESEQQQEQYNQQKTICAQLKSEIQVLQSEQKNLNQLMAKSTVKADAKAVQLMQVLQLNAQGKQHANLVEKFLAKWLSAHVLDEQNDFVESIARQFKVSVCKDRIQLNSLPCLADWIESPHHSLWAHVAITANLAEALNMQAQLKTGQSLLSLDGYHVGQDWVIGLFYDEASQAAQGALSHRIRLDEIEQKLAELQAQFTTAEALLPPAQQQIVVLKNQLQQQQEQLKTQQKQLQNLDVVIAKQQSASQAFDLQKVQLNHQLQQLEEQLEEDAMQKDDLDIDLHALSFKLEENLPEYKTWQYQLDELNEQLEAQQQTAQAKQQNLEATRRVLEQNKQQTELLEKDLNFSKSAISANFGTNGTVEKIC